MASRARWGRDRSWYKREWPLAGGWVGDPHEEHVPVGAGPTAPFRIARDPLLLGAGPHIAIDQGIRHPAAARPSTLLVEHDIASYVHASKGDGLGNCPLHHARGWGDRKALDGLPEGTGGVVIGQGGIATDVARNV